MKNFIKIACLILVVIDTFCAVGFAKESEYQYPISKLHQWINSNCSAQGLPYSHIGDERFENWTITYDAAVVAIAYTALGDLKKAAGIIDFYIRERRVRRLGGFVEAFIGGDEFVGKDWSVRSGANIWLGIAGFHLYKNNHQKEYLDFALQVGGWILDLQNNDHSDSNYGGVRLGPKGDPQFVGDQRIFHGAESFKFDEIYSTEINIDAYALMNMLYRQTKEKKYREGRDNVFIWLKKNGYNSLSHRFNRGFHDTVVATDVQSWAISSLGVENLDKIEKGLAEETIRFVENNCLSEVDYELADGQVIKVIGVDFVDKQRALDLGRIPLVSPEWTFQLINAYHKLGKYFLDKGDSAKAKTYFLRKNNLMKSILSIAIEQKDGSLAYPYATHDEALIGHEYRTPKKGNLSVIGVAYAILALKEYDPLVYPE